MINVGKRVRLKPNDRDITEEGIVWFNDHQGNITVLVYPMYRYGGDDGYRHITEANIAKQMDT